MDIEAAFPVRPGKDHFFSLPSPFVLPHYLTTCSISWIWGRKPLTGKTATKKEDHDCKHVLSRGVHLHLFVLFSFVWDRISLYSRLDWNSQRYSFLCPLSAGIKGVLSMPGRCFLFKHCFIITRNVSHLPGMSWLPLGWIVQIISLCPEVTHSWLPTALQKALWFCHSCCCSRGQGRRCLQASLLSYLVCLRYEGHWFLPTAIIFVP